MIARAFVAALAGARRVRGPVFLLSDDIWPANFSHWMLDALPRLDALAAAGLREGVTIATGPLGASWQRETLRHCGVDPSRLRVIETTPDIASIARSWAARSR